MKTLRYLCLVGPLLFQALPLSHGMAVGSEGVEFNRDVRPILSARCFGCHGPDDASREADLRLDQFAGAIADLGGRAAIVPGDPQASELMRRITSDDPEVRMPPQGKPSLAPKEIAALREWIAQGAEYKRHWAFVPPQRPAVPEVRNQGWVRNAIDAFVLARIEAAGIQPAPEAEATTLLRRVWLDLVGLPPVLEQLEAFERDVEASGVDAAYERVVERLLESPYYGERWARRWLDLARYADTNGYEKDRDRSMWPYRDWVIRALNADMPFDQFTVEQIAGDLLPGATIEQQVATGFHRNTMLNEEGGIDPLEFRFYAMTDRVATTGVVWLGLTLGCAQCHSHKYDPISHTDYYQLMAFLDNADEPEIELKDPRLDADHRHRQAEADLLLAAMRTKWPLSDADARAVDRQAMLTEAETALLAQLRERFSAWLTLTREGVRHWTPLRPLSAKTNSLLLTILDDHSLLASGDTTKIDVYDIEFAAPPDGVTAIRLETLTDASLPNGGPGTTYYEGTKGDFFLGEFRLAADGVPVTLASATHSYAKNQYGDETSRPVSAALTIDGDPQTGWSVYQGEGRPHTAVYQLAAPLKSASRLQLTTECGRHFASSLGRFRLSATTDPGSAVATDLSAEVESLLLLPHDQLNAHQQEDLWEAFLLRQPEFKEQHDSITQLQQPLAYPRAMVMRERPSHHPRVTHRRYRGEYLQRAEAMTAETPSELPPLAADQPRNRLGFARWLASSNNPLTARVTVNRHWAALFGRGLVATLDDFGVQGAPPTHPELLDWLAVEFVDQGWSLKRLHQLLVTSAAYRQSSQVLPQTAALDPDNHLFARAARPRLEAEVIRDAVLRASDLLSLKVGGPSVYPPQPVGVTEVAFGNPSWPTSVGEARFRRSLYTYRKRTAPFAMYDAFDAPSGEACTARRDISNTPLQALTLLNDGLFLESAQALGSLLASSPADDASRVRIAFTRVLSRPPSDEETARVLAFVGRQRERFEAGEIDPAPLAQTPPSSSPRDGAAEDRSLLGERAAWTALARALFSLDESLTRN